MINLKDYDADNVLAYIAADPEEWVQNFVRSRIKIAELEMIRRGLNPNDKAVQLPDLATIPGIPKIVDLANLSDDLRHKIARKTKHDKKGPHKAPIQPHGSNLRRSQRGASPGKSKR